MSSGYVPAVSVVVNTDGRRQSIENCLVSLKHQNYQNLEVVVVVGPTDDGTYEFVQDNFSFVKLIRCNARNLSQSRNLGIKHSSGELIAFIDDDAIAEPEWISKSVNHFQDQEVACLAGFLIDHTGQNFQWTFGTVNRLGVAKTHISTPSPHLNFPGSFEFPHAMGANMIFRRESLVQIGGFDEEFEYYLEESDVMVRLIDRGYVVAQTDIASVHHKYMSSAIRSESKALTSWFSVVKNKIYFCNKHASAVISKKEVDQEIDRFVGELRLSLEAAIISGRLNSDLVRVFEKEVNAAKSTAEVSISRGFPKTLQPDEFEAPAVSFEQIPKPENPPLCLVFLSQDYPPASPGGIARYIETLATGLAEHGDQVHVIARSSDHSTLDLQDGVWVHRVVDAPLEVNTTHEGPTAVISRATAVKLEIEKILDRRSIDVIYSPIWDVEGIEVIDKAALVVGLQTSMATYLETNPEMAENKAFVKNIANPIITLERNLLQSATAIHAISADILEKIQKQYPDLSLSEKSTVAHLGLDDRLSLARQSLAKPEKEFHITFVGRLEPRKGIDLLLQVAPDLLREFPQAVLNIVGKDVGAGPGHSYEKEFTKKNKELISRGRIRFLGEVSEDELDGHYRNAEIVVAPSRYESFGLVHLESQMYGKAVIGSRIGGMQEIIKHGETGFLIKPGDSRDLYETLKSCIDGVQNIELIGIQARQNFLERHGKNRVVSDVRSILLSALGAVPN